MGGTNVTKETRGRVASNGTRLNAEMLPVKPVVLAGENRLQDENFRDLRKHDDGTEHHEC